MDTILFSEFFPRLVVAILLGMVIGAERISAGKTAGMRTHALVAMGAALFVIISEVIALQYVGMAGFDPLRVASQIVVGIGFLGAGSIIFTGTHVSGLTTAAGLWVAAGIGMASGYGLYGMAISATLLTLFVFTGLWYVESKVKKISRIYNTTDSPEIK